MKKTLSLATALIAVFMFVPSLLSVPSMASEKVDIQKLIQNATSAEDHIEIAEYYENQSAKAESKAGLHASMAKAYQRNSKRKVLAKHCTNLTKKYEEVAEEYSTLAIEHRKIAAQLKNK